MADRTLVDALNDVNADLALRRITREQAIDRIIEGRGITRRGAEDLLDNGIQIDMHSRHEDQCRILDAGQRGAARKFPRRR